MADTNQENQVKPDNSGDDNTEEVVNAPLSSNQPTPQAPDEKKPSPVERLKSVNPFIGLLVLVVAIGVGVIIFLTVSNNNNELSFTSVELSEEDINNLASSQAEIASNADLLKVAPNSEFDQSVVIKKNLEVVGDITVGGEVNIPGIGTTNGTELEQANIAGDLAVQGNSQINGNLNIQNSLNVAGDVTISGELIADTITVNQLNFSSDLVISRHIRSNAGSTTASSGSAVGAGGTVSVSGNDVAGTANINTGGGTSTGALVTISFRENYTSTPAVVITPVGSGAASFDYYITRNSGGFTIYARSAPATGSNFQFDYIVIE